MNEKEIAEIRRRFKEDRNNISVIRGCYVNTDHEIISGFKQSVAMLTVEEYEKYLAIFRKTLSGTPQKNLIDIQFTSNAVLYSPQHQLLMKLKDSRLTDDEAVKMFFDSVISSLPNDDNYLLLLMSDTYDLPSNGKDEDSTEIFSYIVCCACPVHNSKPSLSYSDDDKVFHNSRLIRQVSMPDFGFMFPAYENHAANIYSSLYYTRDGSLSGGDFARSAFDCELPMPAKEQRSTFCSVLEKSLGDSCSLDVVQTVGDRLNDIIEEHKQDKEEPLTFSKHFVRSALETCGVEDEKITSFEKMFDEEFGNNAELSPKNIVGNGRTELRTPDVVINVTAGKGDLVETRVINGSKYILVRADAGVEVNGVNISIGE